MSFQALAWLALTVSGALECVWAVALAKSRGFTKRSAVVVFIAALAASTLLLAFAMTQLPTGTAYAFWVGIGAALTVVWSMLTGEERPTVARVALITLLVACAIGLKVVA